MESPLASSESIKSPQSTKSPKPTKARKATKSRKSTESPKPAKSPKSTTNPPSTKSAKQKGAKRKDNPALVNRTNQKDNLPLVGGNTPAIVVSNQKSLRSRLHSNEVNSKRPKKPRTEKPNPGEVKDPVHPAIAPTNHATVTSAGVTLGPAASSVQVLEPLPCYTQPLAIPFSVPVPFVASHAAILSKFRPSLLSVSDVRRYLIQQRVQVVSACQQFEFEKQRVETALLKVENSIKQLSEQVRAEGKQGDSAIHGLTDEAVRILDITNPLHGFSWKSPICMVLRSYYIAAMYLIQFYNGRYGLGLDRCSWAYIPVSSPMGIGILFSKSLLLAWIGKRFEFDNMLSALQQACADDQPETSVLDTYRAWFPVAHSKISNESVLESSDDESADETVQAERKDDNHAKNQPPRRKRGRPQVQPKRRLVCDIIEDDLLFIPQHKWQYLCDATATHASVRAPLLLKSLEGFVKPQFQPYMKTGFNVVRNHNTWDSASWHPCTLWDVSVPGASGNPTNKSNLRRDILEEVAKTGILGLHWNQQAVADTLVSLSRSPGKEANEGNKKADEKSAPLQENKVESKENSSTELEEELKNEAKVEMKVDSYKLVVAKSIGLHPDLLDALWTDLKDRVRRSEILKWWNVNYAAKYPFTTTLSRSFPKGPGEESVN